MTPFGGFRSWFGPNHCVLFISGKDGDEEGPFFETTPRSALLADGGQGFLSSETHGHGRRFPA